MKKTNKQKNKQAAILASNVANSSLQKKKKNLPSNHESEAHINVLQIKIIRDK